MTCAVAVGTHFFQQSDLVFLDVIRNRPAGNSEILVGTYAFDLDRLTVQKQSFFAVGSEFTEACMGPVFIYRLPSANRVVTTL